VVQVGATIDELTQVFPFPPPVCHVSAAVSVCVFPFPQFEDIILELSP
jgi:hypothetical protein